jgi:hypothetical protein
MALYTDYPLTELGDIPYKEAPIRELVLLKHDGGKYCDILIEEKVFNIKIGYIYTKDKNGKMVSIANNGYYFFNTHSLPCTKCPYYITIHQSEEHATGICTKCGHSFCTRYTKPKS